jgi:hypothetical protein
MKEIRTDRTPYKADFLNSLRNAVIEKYLDNNPSKKNQTILFGTDKYSKIYTRLNEDFLLNIGREFGGKTLVKFFYRKKDQMGQLIPLSDDVIYDDQTINDLLRYSTKNLKTNESTVTKESLIIPADIKRFHGCDLIDSAFKTRAQEIGMPFEFIHFYTYKDNNDLQWKGIAEELDIERNALVGLKSAAYQGFENINCKVIAVLQGNVGTGKTTVLRRLAWDLEENGNFEILWIYSLVLFVPELGEIRNNGKRYLLIIDNWPDVEKDRTSKQAFISQINNANNVRVIIGDTFSKKRVYKKYVYGHNYLKVTNEENIKVIEGISEKVKEWRFLKENLYFFFNKEFYKAPLALLLLVLESFSTIDDSANKKDFYAQLINIIHHVLNEIYNHYPGLAQTLYYWAHLQKKYNLQISHLSFFALAEHINGGKKPILRIGEQETLVEMYLYLITIKEIYVPGKRDVYYMAFYDECIKDALTKIEDDIFRFNEKVVFELLEGMVEIGDKAIATDLFVQIYNKNQFINNDYLISFAEENLGIVTTASFIRLITANTILTDLFTKLDVYSEEIIENRLFIIINDFHELDLGTAEIDEVFLMLLKCECKASIVAELYNMTGDYASRMIAYKSMQGAGFLTKLNFYRELGYYIDDTPNPENSRWLKLYSLETLNNCRNLTNKPIYSIKK